MWNAPLCAAAATEIAQDDVRVQIPDFADDVEQECDIGDVGVGRPGGWSGGPVGPEGDVCATEKPVVGRVFEDVQEGHAGGGESVDEESFKLAFDEVQHYECESERLELGRAGGRRQEGVQDRMDEDGPQIFDQEDGAPS